MASKKRDRDDAESGADWQAKGSYRDVFPDDWARAGCAADAVVKRALKYTTGTPSDDAIFAQHVKVQLAYLNMRRTVNLSGNVDGDIGCYLNNELDVNLANKNDKGLSVVHDSSLTLDGGLDVYVDNNDREFEVKVAKS